MILYRCRFRVVEELGGDLSRTLGSWGFRESSIKGERAPSRVERVLIWVEGSLGLGFRVQSEPCTTPCQESDPEPS